MTNAIAQKQTLNVPGPSPSPILGTIPNIIKFSKDSVAYSRQLFEKYGNLVSLAEGGGTRLYSPYPECPGTVFACGPEVVRQVATQPDVYYKCPLTGPIYRYRQESERTKALNHFLVGIFGANEDRHKQQRKLMMPAFHNQRLSSYLQDMVSITADELHQLEIGRVQNLATAMQQVTLRIASKSFFGEDVGAEGASTGELLHAALEVQSSLALRLMRFDVPGLPWHRYLNLTEQYGQAMQSLIAAKRARGTDDPDILSMLMQVQDEETQEKLSEEELLGHVGVIFIAGHETSANALTWTLLLLSQHPQIMSDLLDELEAELQGAPPTLEQLKSLPLLERVIKESMRVLSSVPWNGRVTAKPTELCGYYLPKGTEVFVSISQTHHMPELFPNPEDFDPSRWETINPTAYEYNPFSAGPRICIGAGFAMMEIKVILAMLLQRYRLEFVPKHPIDRTGTIVMRPKYGLFMKVHAQDRQFTAGVGKVKGNIRDMVNLP